MSLALTRRQADCLRAIEDLTVDGVGPTYDQLRVRLGIGSKSGIHRLITALRERGRVRHLHGRRQSLEVVCSTVPTKTKAEIADGVCQRVWEAKQEGRTVHREDLHAMVMEALS